MSGDSDSNQTKQPVKVLHLAAASEVEDRFGDTDVLALGARLALKFGKGGITGEGVFETGEIGGDDLSALAFGAKAYTKFGDKSMWWKPMAG